MTDPVPCIGETDKGKVETGFVPWLRGLAEKGGKGVVNNIDARCLGRIADELERLAVTRHEETISGAATGGASETLASEQTVSSLTVGAGSNPASGAKPVAWSQRPNVFPESGPPQYTHVSREKTGPYPYPLYASPGHDLQFIIEAVRKYDKGELSKGELAGLLHVTPQKGQEP